MQNAIASEERLSIPLSRTLSEAYQSSRISALDAAVAIPSAVIVFFLTRDPLFSALAFFIFYAALSFRVQDARKRLRHIEPSVVPSWILDARGMEVPVFLLRFGDPNIAYLNACNRSHVRIGWEQIHRWKVADRALDIEGYYLTVAKGTVTPLQTKIILRRDFSKAQEKIIFDFVRRAGVNVAEPGFWARNLSKSHPAA